WQVHRERNFAQLEFARCLSHDDYEPTPVAHTETVRASTGR
ncbi:MAG: hypothetical protein RLZZ600_387, partial [Actinomycetota bacterium]